MLNRSSRSGCLHTVVTPIVLFLVSKTLIVWLIIQNMQNRQQGIDIFSASLMSDKLELRLYLTLVLDISFLTHAYTLYCTDVNSNS